MPRSLTDIDADIAAVRAAVGTGASRLRFADGREVHYRSQADLERALGFLEAERAAATGAAPLRVTLVAHSRA